MLGSFVKYRICCYIQCSLVITNSMAGLECSILKSFNNCKTQVISQATLAMALYSASAEDLDTTPYFFDLQEIKESPKHTA